MKKVLLGFGLVFWILLTIVDCWGAAAVPVSTALYNAIVSDNTDTVNSLVTKTPDIVNKIMDGTYTPLTAARSIEMIDWLIGKGADINLLDGDGKTPLIMQLDVNRKDLFLYLLEKGADIYIPDKKVKSILSYAAEKELVGIVETLIEKAEKEGRINDLTKQDSLKRTPLHYAAFAGNQAIYDLLKEHCSEDLQDVTQTPRQRLQDALAKKGPVPVLSAKTAAVPADQSVTTLNTAFQIVRDRVIALNNGLRTLIGMEPLDWPGDDEKKAAGPAAVKPQPSPEELGRRAVADDEEKEAEPNPANLAAAYVPPVPAAFEEPVIQPAPVVAVEQLPLTQEEEKILLEALSGKNGALSDRKAELEKELAKVDYKLDGQYKFDIINKFDASLEAAKPSDDIVDQKLFNDCFNLKNRNGFNLLKSQAEWYMQRREVTYDSYREMGKKEPQPQQYGYASYGSAAVDDASFKSYGECKPDEIIKNINAEQEIKSQSNASTTENYNGLNSPLNKLKSLFKAYKPSQMQLANSKEVESLSSAKKDVAFWSHKIKEETNTGLKKFYEEVRLPEAEKKVVDCAKALIEDTQKGLGVQAELKRLVVEKNVYAWILKVIADPNIMYLLVGNSDKLRIISDFMTIVIDNGIKEPGDILNDLLPLLHYRAQSLATAYILLKNHYQDPAFLAWAAGALLWYVGQDTNFGEISKYCTYQFFQIIKECPIKMLDGVIEQCMLYDDSEEKLRVDQMISREGDLKAPQVGQYIDLHYINAWAKLGENRKPFGRTDKGRQIRDQLLSFIAARKLRDAADERLRELDRKKEELAKIDAQILENNLKIAELNQKQLEREQEQQEIRAKEQARLEAEERAKELERENERQRQEEIRAQKAKEELERKEAELKAAEERAQRVLAEQKAAEEAKRRELLVQQEQERKEAEERMARELAEQRKKEDEEALQAFIAQQEREKARIAEKQKADELAQQQALAEQQRLADAAQEKARKAQEELEQQRETARIQQENERKAAEEATRQALADKKKKDDEEAAKRKQLEEERVAAAAKRKQLEEERAAAEVKQKAEDAKRAEEHTAKARVLNIDMQRLDEAIGNLVQAVKIKDQGKNIWEATTLNLDGYLTLFSSEGDYDFLLRKYGQTYLRLIDVIGSIVKHIFANTVTLEFLVLDQGNGSRKTEFEKTWKDKNNVKKPEFFTRLELLGNFVEFFFAHKKDIYEKLQGQGEALVRSDVDSLKGKTRYGKHLCCYFTIKGGFWAADEKQLENTLGQTLSFATNIANLARAAFKAKQKKA